MCIPDNYIGSRGTIALAEALKDSTTMETVYLWSKCPILLTLSSPHHRESLSVCVCAFERCPGNSIDVDGARAISKCLAENKSLKTLGLYGKYGVDRSIDRSSCSQLNSAFLLLHVMNVHTCW